MTLQPKLDERDQEIVRLRGGYDNYLFRRFIRRFIRVDTRLTEAMLRPGADRSTLGSIRALMEDALAECGVEQFAPEIGTDFRRADGVADNPTTVPNADQSKAYKIAEVRRAGYRTIEGTGNRVIVPAEVAVYSAPAK
jgi:molecular chaperone GrpE (heat shock protein)